MSLRDIGISCPIADDTWNVRLRHHPGTYQLSAITCCRRTVSTLSRCLGLQCHHDDAHHPLFGCRSPCRYIFNSNHPCHQLTSCKRLHPSLAGSPHCQHECCASAVAFCVFMFCHSHVDLGMFSDIHGFCLQPYKSNHFHRSFCVAVDACYSRKMLHCKAIVFPTPCQRLSGNPSPVLRVQHVVKMGGT